MYFSRFTTLEIISELRSDNAIVDTSNLVLLIDCQIEVNILSYNLLNFRFFSLPIMSINVVQFNV